MTRLAVRCTRSCLWFGALGFHIPAAASSAQGGADRPAAEIAITVGAAGRATVQARFTATGRPTDELRMLNRSCSSIGDLVVERAGARIAPLSDTSGPWLVLRDTSTAPGDSGAWLVSYNVATGPSAEIPLIHPATPMPRGAAGTGSVLVGLSFTSEGRVVFPHMVRDAGGAWSARYVAVPSFVTARVPSSTAAACDTVRVTAGGDGGLTWRFFLLVGIMLLWVPIYQAWARRSEAGVE